MKIKKMIGFVLIAFIYIGLIWIFPLSLNQDFGLETLIILLIFHGLFIIGTILSIFLFWCFD